MARSISAGQANNRINRRAQTPAAAYYADGSTVRKALPARREAVVPARRREMPAHRRAGAAAGMTAGAAAVPARRYREEAAQQEARRSAAVQARPRTRAEQSELSIDLPFLLMLTAAVLATLFICFNYLRLNASIDARMDNIEHLEAQLENLKTENDALEQSIDTSVDLNYVYNVAVNELGMVHAGKDNIINYDKTESEYVRQNENIPKK